MGRPRRHFDKNTVYIIKNHCLENQARFTPTPEIEESVRGLMTKYTAGFGIDLIAFVFVPAGFKLLVRAPRQNLHQFMCLLQTNLSKDINKIQGRKGPVLAGRFSAEPVMPDEQERVMAEIIKQVCMDDLVAHPRDWPGLSAWSALISGDEIVGQRVDRSLYWRLKMDPEYRGTSDAELLEMATMTYRVRLSPLPVWEELSEEERRKKIEEFADEIAEERQAAWEMVYGDDEAAPQIPGIDEVLALTSYQRVDFWRPMRRGHCHTMDDAEIKAFCEARTARDKMYEEGARKLRAGESEVYFPDGMIPPGHLHCVGSPDAISCGESCQKPLSAPSIDEPQQAEPTGSPAAATTSLLRSEG